MSLPSTKKVCINSSKNYYTGTELSPLHFGLSAEGYDINSIMEGYDNELWIVDIKNNKKIWVKNEYLSRITYEEPVIKNILSLYNNTEDIEKINQLKQICGKDGSYNLKDINKISDAFTDKMYNIDLLSYSNLDYLKYSHYALELKNKDVFLSLMRGILDSEYDKKN